MINIVLREFHINTKIKVVAFVEHKKVFLIIWGLSSPIVESFKGHFAFVKNHTYWPATED